MNEYSCRLAKPHCENCHKPKKIEEKIDEILPSLSLADRLSQTIKQAKTEEDEI